MSTAIRPELSEKNKYWIEKHRYYELKHFCLQYPIWKKTYISLDGFAKKPDDLIGTGRKQNLSDPTVMCTEKRLFYADRMNMVSAIAQETEPELAEYILQAVTNGLSYDILKARLEIPCCKDVYYNLYRRFFWLLSKERG